MMTNEVAKFEQFFASVSERLEQARTTDEVIAIREQAAALAAAARALKDRKYEEKAANVKLQSERRLGQLMAAQRDAGMMKEGRPKRGNENPVLVSVGIDKNLAKAARKAYPEGWPSKPRPQRMTPRELETVGRSPKAERYKTEDGGSKSRIKLISDENRSLKAENSKLKGEVVRLRDDLEAIQTGQLMRMSQMAMEQRRVLAAKMKANREIRKSTETIPDTKTVEDYERQIQRLKAQINTEKGKALSLAAQRNGLAAISKEDRKAILVCLHPDGTADPRERARRERAFQLFNGALPEPAF